ncbi:MULTISPECIES: O-methyltransferase [Streptomyces]|uniref:O-methyltransferase n=1 Tax=Streptomyces TaxID=1883 RepID=UPI0019034088|nr:class I SAM-dependent methyltransferase [Streptomyces sp. XC 2026]QQN77742.1 class I SAM-dependent methyltransferase [Streptomyces sp. XC 2026]
MDDRPWQRPAALDAILADASGMGFRMSCEARTGSLLATLAASKPGGRLLELGTGVGAGAAWLLHGMTATAELVSVETDSRIQEVAARHLGTDSRVTFEQGGADEWLDRYDGPPLALAYVDCRPGKFHRLGDLLDLLEPGGLYVVDDLLPQGTWPDGHQARVDAWLAHVPSESKIRSTPMCWASGLLIGAKT